MLEGQTAKSQGLMVKSQGLMVIFATFNQGTILQKNILPT
ncbi:hypothetical protein NIES37_13690 [Tolypothrix tenuis PCC 7101]|uniref:Uncharacterized protein n=1 Tax=Tolypothrix tenuis PCC 7101 TaxID=231146 RepID=A0A1Z4MVG9_9CYAN|nr:hypothetical protein NIES37_13690 [Tolypothrix tenuis PCC 7101]BAZ72064.1 hypothetical protein NIES50_06130 [Aulosira laxa NIES-50]